jgi:hypothetical protein
MATYSKAAQKKVKRINGRARRSTQQRSEGEINFKKEK